MSELSCDKIILVKFSMGFAFFGTFLIDIHTPFGIAVSMFYVLPVLFSLWAPELNYPILIGLLGSLLTLTGAFLWQEEGIHWMAVTNRILTIALIWTAVYLCGLQKSLTLQKRPSTIPR